MRDHLPPVGVLPPPAQDNVLAINRLQDTAFQTGLPKPVGRCAPEEATLSRCNACKGTFWFSAGYVFLDDFYCDRCLENVLRESRPFDGN